jgi:hypothetical protein
VSSNVEIAIVSGLLSGGFAVLGGAITTLTASRREVRNFRTETALELAGMERFVWGNSWTELEAHLERQQARLTVAGVPEDLVTAFQSISLACWRDLRDSRELSGGEDSGIAKELLEARREVHRAIRAHLLREKQRSSRDDLRRAATTRVETVLASYERRWGRGG